MIPKITLLVVVALATALPLSLPGAAEAALLLGPGSEARSQSIVEQVRNKVYQKLYWKQTETPQADGSGAASVPPGAAQKAVVRHGQCGTYMYWDKKAKKCADARDSKK